MPNTFLASIVPLLLFVLIPATTALAGERVRIATYNIQFLSSDVVTQDDRLSKLEEVLQKLNADVIGLQEIKDRAALNLLFPPHEWHIVIDDDSNKVQDLAAVVRKRFHLPRLPNDLDAEDAHFLFPSPMDNWAFPKRRDVLRVDIELPDRTDGFTFLVHHAKSRFDGRSKTNAQRVAASERIVEYLRPSLINNKVVLVCDCNDTPDDQSVNILETGNPEANAEMENSRGSFLINLTEPVSAAGHVSYGRKSDNIVDERVDTVDAEARQRNFDGRISDKHTGDQLFDQILVSPGIFVLYQADSAGVFDRVAAVRGNRDNRASDHLPVYADFVFPTKLIEQPPSNESAH